MKSRKTTTSKLIPLSNAPTPAYMQAVRDVLGISDLVPGPQIVIPALRGLAGPLIDARHTEIIRSRSGQAANEAIQDRKFKTDEQEAKAWLKVYRARLAETVEAA
jgi:hypothetical protein